MEIFKMKRWLDLFYGNPTATMKSYLNIQY